MPGDFLAVAGAGELDVRIQVNNGRRGVPIFEGRVLPVVVDKVEAELVIEPAMLLLAEDLVPLEELPHYLIRVLEVVARNRIGGDGIIDSDGSLILHHRGLHIIVLPHPLLDLPSVHVVEHALPVLVATCEVALVAVAISYMWE